MTFKELECRVYELEECCRPDEVNLTWIDVEGLAAGNYKWAINMQTGDTYYKNSYATWSKMVGGGGTGGTGATGPQGPIGPQGPQGPAGEVSTVPGPQGLPGEDGEGYGEVDGGFAASTYLTTQSVDGGLAILPKE